VARGLGAFRLTLLKGEMPMSKSVVTRLATAIATAALPFAVVAAPEHYVIDPYHSFPHFEVDHLGYAWIRGRFD